MQQKRRNAKMASYLNYEKMKEKVADARESMMDLEKQLEARIAKNPVRSVLIAFGIGAAAGMLTYMFARGRNAR